jgi:hypothetical protein
MVYHMFDSTINFFKEFTRVNDFAQVSAASVWTMRWQVKGFFAEAGFYDGTRMRPKQADLKSRFLAGSGLRRANFRSLVDGQTWPEQASVLAEMTLLSITSLFEGWAETISDEVGLSRSNRDAIQWPSHSKYPRFNNVGSPTPGIGEALQAGRSPASNVMEQCFSPTYKSDSQYSLAPIDDLMICYRYWKEIRNAVAHAGGRATDRCLAEEIRLSSLTPSDLGMSRVPRLAPLVLNFPVPVDLESVLGFGEVLHRIAVTVDAEFSIGKAAEAIMLRRWEAVRRAYYSDPPIADPGRRMGRIKHWMLSAGMPRPHEPETLEAFLTSRYGSHLDVRQDG